jgi:hypothetical protein
LTYRVAVDEQRAEPGFDVDVVVGMARGQDPGLPDHLARELAVLAEEELGTMAEPDVSELARRLLAKGPDGGATPAAVVARAAVTYVQERALRG